MAKLLIIEDDPFVRRFYEKLFRFKKFDFEITSDGLDGIIKAKSGKFDLIILDIVLPKIDGLEVLRRLKQDPQTADINVIMLTNIEDHSVAKKAASLGALGFIIKSSVEPEKLPDKISEFLNK